MPKYIVLYTAPVSAEAQMQSNDPAMAAEVMKAWTDWAAKAGDSMVDLGLPLGDGRKITSSGATAANTKVSGYSILQAKSADAAVKLLESHPHLQMPGAAVEVYETIELPAGM
jgi:hypothetical protein